VSTLAVARLPFARLVRTRRGVIAFVWWTVFAVGTVLIARHESASSADLALLGVYLPFVLPLVAHAMVGAVLGGEGIVVAVQPLTRFGASPFGSAITTGVVATLACAVSCAATAVLLLASAHNALDPPLAQDLALTAYAGALAGGAHGAFFVLGSAVFARGGGRSALLLVNWLLGASPSWISALVPYSHSRSLLGGQPVVTLSEGASAWCLVAITVVSLALAASRVSLRRR
jgi:hypothetical protein